MAKQAVHISLDVEVIAEIDEARSAVIPTETRSQFIAVAAQERARKARRAARRSE